MYFGHKHIETGPNYLHELATFLKYHMPLSNKYEYRDENVFFKVFRMLK